MTFPRYSVGIIKSVSSLGFIGSCGYLNNRLVANYFKLEFIRGLSSIGPKTSSDTAIKPHLNVCFLGDHGHGKTTLVSAITLVQSKSNLATFKDTFDIDNAKDEIEKKCSINPTRIKLETKKRSYLLTDLPGSPDYMRNTVTGGSGSDYAVIVVAGNEGPTKTTRNHLIIAKHLGIKRMVGFISKIDKTDGESIEIVEMAAKEMLDEEGFNADEVKFVQGCANSILTDTENTLKYPPIIDLLEKLDELPAIDRDHASIGTMYIDKIYSPPNRATGVTGIIERGKFSKGDKIELIGFNKCIRTSILSIESFGSVKEHAVAGDSVEMLIKSVKRTDLVKGMIVVPVQSSLEGSDRVEVLLKMLPARDDEKYILFSDGSAECFCRTGLIVAGVFIKDKSHLVSGDSGLVELRLSKEFVFQNQQSLLFRDGQRIFGLGQVTQILPNMSINERKAFLKPKTKSEREEFLEFKKKLREEVGIKSFF